MPPTRAGKHQHRGARGPSSNRGCVSVRLCAPFDADTERPSMKMRSMPRGTLFTALPFAVVAALATGIALAGYIANPYPIADPTRANSSTPPSTAAPIAADTASPPASTAAPTKAAGSNDAVEMLRVHNELRAAVGAPAVRGDDRGDRVRLHGHRAGPRALARSRPARRRYVAGTGIARRPARRCEPARRLSRDGRLLGRASGRPSGRADHRRRGSRPRAIGRPA